MTLRAENMAQNIVQIISFLTQLQDDTLAYAIFNKILPDMLDESGALCHDDRRLLPRSIQGQGQFKVKHRSMQLGSAPIAGLTYYSKRTHC